jgi:hypothetical protein
MFHLGKEYTSGELIQMYATKARRLFNLHQKRRTWYSRFNLLLMLSIMTLGVLTLKFTWCSIPLVLISLVPLVTRTNQKAVDHALAAMNYLRHAQTFESMHNEEQILPAIEAFEADTLYY